MEQLQVYEVRKRTTDRWGFNLLIFCLILLFGLLIFVVYNLSTRHVVKEDTIEVIQLGHHGDEMHSEEACEEDLCLTKGCITVAARLITNMDDTKDPCQDFYDFACGNYPKEKFVREGEEVYDPFTEAKDNIVIFIKKTFDHFEKINPTDSALKTRAVYETCMNYDKRANESVSVLHNFLHDSGLKFPILEEDDVEGQSWSHIVTEMEKYRFHTLFMPTFTSFTDNETVIINIDCPTLTMLPVEYHLNSTEERNMKRLSFYESVVTIYLKHLNLSWVQAKKISKQIIETERKIAQAFTEVENEGENDCNEPCDKSRCLPCKESSMAERHPLSDDHKMQLKSIWSNLIKKENSQIEMRSTCNGNLEAVLTLLNDDSTEKKSILNYLGWRAAAHLAQYLSPKLQNEYNHYVGKLLEAPSIPVVKWRECGELIRKEMGVAVSKILMERGYINEAQLTEAKKRFLETKTALKATFKTIPWVNNQSYDVLSAKVDKISLEIGTPEYLNQDDDKMDELSRELDVSLGDSFLNNIMRLRAFKTRKYYSNLLSQHDHDSDDLTNYFDLDYSPLNTGSSYDYKTNRVKVDFGLLMSPLFKYGDGLAKYLEFGQNVFLAHEVSHAFDTIGIQYDGNGNFIGMAVLPEKIREKFYNFVMCLLRQLPQDPPKQIDNDIADLGAAFTTVASLELHLKQETHDDAEKLLPALPFNKRQLFFLQSAQVFCETREEPVRKKLRRGIKERLNAAISNMIHFAPAFDCHAGTPMNPVNKCNLLVV